MLWPPRACRTDKHVELESVFWLFQSVLRDTCMRHVCAVALTDEALRLQIRTPAISKLLDVKPMPQKGVLEYEPKRGHGGPSRSSKLEKSRVSLLRDSWHAQYPHHADRPIHAALFSTLLSTSTSDQKTKQTQYEPCPKPKRCRQCLASGRGAFLKEVWAFWEPPCRG